MFPHFSSTFIRKDEDIPEEITDERGFEEVPLTWCPLEHQQQTPVESTVRLPRMSSALRQLDLENLSRDNGPPTELRNRKEKLVRFEKECSQVGDGLYVGGEVVAKNKEILKGHGITHVVNCVGFLYPAYYEDEFRYQTLYLQDTPKEDILSVLYDVFDFIEDGKNTGNVFIHCSQGVSRSTTLAIAYRMWLEKRQYEDVFAEVKERRGVANPNIGFICQLIQWYKRRTEDAEFAKVYRIAPQSSSAPKYLVPKWVSSGCDRMSLDPRGVFVVHIPGTIFLWEGAKSPDEFVAAAYKFANQLRKYEVNNPIETIDVVKVEQGQETEQFWKAVALLSEGSQALDVETCSSYDNDFDIWSRASFSSKASDMLNPDTCDSARSGRKTPRVEGDHSLSPNDRMKKFARASCTVTDNSDVQSSKRSGTPEFTVSYRRGSTSPTMLSSQGSKKNVRSRFKIPSLDVPSDGISPGHVSGRSDSQSSAGQGQSETSSSDLSGDHAGLQVADEETKITVTKDKDTPAVVPRLNLG